MAFHSPKVSNFGEIHELKSLRKTCHPIIYYPIKILYNYGIAICFVYILIPFSDIGFGFWNLCCHDSYKNKETHNNDRFSDWHSTYPAWKLFEQFGEAIPQFIIAVIFYSNNSDWLSFYEMLLGGFTMTLSCGSIVFGIVNGVISVPKCLEISRNRRNMAMDQNDA